MEGLEFDPDLVIRWGHPAIVFTVNHRLLHATAAGAGCAACALAGLHRRTSLNNSMMIPHSICGFCAGDRGLIVDKELGNLVKVDRFGCAQPPFTFTP